MGYQKVADGSVSECKLHAQDNEHDHLETLFVMPSKVSPGHTINSHSINVYSKSYKDL